MHLIDWFILIGTITFIVAYGAWRTRVNKNVAEYLRGDNEAGWWTVGLSVMATQASAITFLSTPGQAYHDGMGFVQFYFGLPIAMIIICLTFIPRFYGLKVYTAYEYLESRFDQKTRTLTAILFLIQRGLSAGITIFAPAIILSAVLGWNLNLLNFVLGMLVIIYTVAGGTRAVNVTHKQQMFVIMVGMVLAFIIIINSLPPGINFSNALEIASASGKMEILDFSIDPNNRYTVWSGILGGGFLALSYFGTDQSQVQRYISASSVSQARLGLIFNGLMKIPMQFFILLTGVMVFVFFQFVPTPLNFNPVFTKGISGSAYSKNYDSLKYSQNLIFEERRNLQLSYIAAGSPSEQYALGKEIRALQNADRKVREEARELVEKVNINAETNDKDYVFIYFILNYLPKGMIGLLLAVILSAAMSSTASELNALASTTTIDLYKRNHKYERSESHYVNASRWFTLMWGIVAVIFASFGTLVENLIQLVNIVGSVFYGTVLGIFLAAFYLKWIRARAIFIAAILSECLVIAVYFMDLMEFLWLNVLGAVLTIFLASLINLTGSNTKKPPVEAVPIE